jgi:FKBP-type peptidyl-prolyl cis-trans isomerase FklB
MRNILLSLTAAGLIIGCQPQKTAENTAENTAEKKTAEVTKASLKGPDEKINYAVGVEIGKNITRNGLPLNDDIFMKGIHDGMEDNKEPLMTEEEMRDVKRDHAKAQRETREKEREEEGKKNKSEGEKFLAANKTKEGVVTTESGLQYKILKEGTGEKPSATDRVSVNYKGTLIDGAEFDSSYKRGKPATFAVNRVVKGWTEALQLMPVGSKWELYIPSELAYGERGSRGQIGPNAVLIFQLELLDIVKPDATKPGDAPKKTTLNPTAAPKVDKKAAEGKKPAPKAEKNAEKKKAEK